MTNERIDQSKPSIVMNKIVMKALSTREYKHKSSKINRSSMGFATAGQVFMDFIRKKYA
jgi:hypothetical protein